jgi:hypothetical protein
LERETGSLRALVAKAAVVGAADLEAAFSNFSFASAFTSSIDLSTFSKVC